MLKFFEECVLYFELTNDLRSFVNMIKEEEGEASTSETDVLAVLASNEDGLNSEDLMKQTAGMDVKARGEAVNALLSSGKIEMLPGHTPGAFVLRLRKGTQIAGATHEEQLVSISLMLLIFAYLFLHVTVQAYQNCTN